MWPQPSSGGRLLYRRLASAATQTTLRALATWNPVPPGFSCMCFHAVLPLQHPYSIPSTRSSPRSRRTTRGARTHANSTTEPENWSRSCSGVCSITALIVAESQTKAAKPDPQQSVVSLHRSVPTEISNTSRSAAARSRNHSCRIRRTA